MDAIREKDHLMTILFMVAQMMRKRITANAGQSGDESQE